MRIKLRCPHCGDWFTLNLGIENGEAGTPESDERTEEADADDEPAPPPARASRGRLIAAVCVVAAVVLIVWASVALRSGRQDETSPPDEVSARPAVTDVEAGQGREGLAESDVTDVVPSGRDLSSAGETESDAVAGEDETAGREDETPGREDETAGREGETAGREGETPGRQDETPGREDATAGRQDETPGREDATAGREDETVGSGGEAAASGDEAGSAGAVDALVASPEAEIPEPVSPAAFERRIIELEIAASERCWIRVKADGVVVADATLNEGERRRWRADGFFELDVGAGDAVRLYLNGEDLGPAGVDARVVEGLRVTKEGIRGR